MPAYLQCLLRSLVLCAADPPPFILAAELERLRVEVHGFHLELGALQAQLAEKDALLERALSDAAAVHHERGAVAARAEEATQAAFNLEKQLREVRQLLEETEKQRLAVTEKLAAAEARCEGLQVRLSCTSIGLSRPSTIYASAPVGRACRQQCGCNNLFAVIAPAPQSVVS